MKTIWISTVVLLAFYANAKPGETYTLTGAEKSVTGIIKADMEQYPELYKGESLNSYISKFKKENRIWKRKLSPGDQWRFPDTIASVKAKNSADTKHLESQFSNPPEGFEEESI